MQLQRVAVRADFCSSRRLMQPPRKNCSGSPLPQLAGGEGPGVRGPSCLMRSSIAFSIRHRPRWDLAIPGIPGCVAGRILSRPDTGRDVHHWLDFLRSDGVSRQPPRSASMRYAKVGRVVRNRIFPPKLLVPTPPITDDLPHGIGKLITRAEIVVLGASACS